MSPPNDDELPDVPAPTGSITGAHIVRRLYEPRDAASLVFFRAAFGVVLLWHAWTFCRNRWVETFFVDPPYHLTYFGFEWVEPLAGMGMRLVFYAMGLAAVGVALGLFYRLSCVVLFVTFTFSFLAEAALYQNHYYLVCLLAFLLIFIPANRCLSFDALIWPKRAGRFVPAWSYGILRFQIAVPYVYGGIAKLNGDWLQAMPVGLWIGERSDLPLIGPYLAERWCAWAVSYGGLVLDLLIVPLLMWKPTRWAAYLAIVGFHVLNSVLFSIDFFPWFMILATPILFPADWPRRLLRLPVDEPLSSSGANPLGPSRRHRLMAGLLAAYVSWQTLLPFQHLLYPGNPSWTEEGQQFAWRMMLRRKDVYIRFYGTDRGSGQTVELPVDLFLNPRQIQAMAVSPDQIVAVAPFLKNAVMVPYFQRQFGQVNDSDIEIRAVALVSLNGREPQLMIDPHLDLTAMERTWGHQAGIIPLEQPLRRDAFRAAIPVPIDALPEVLRPLQPRHPVRVGQVRQ